MGSVTVVFDTNVFISAAGFGGTPEQCIKRAFADDITVVISEPILDEFESVLKYEHLPFSESEIRDVPRTFLRLTGAEIIEPAESLDVIDDPDDNKFLECAVGASADYLISGDKDHVQPVGQFRGVSIVSPREFLDAVGAPS